MIHFYINNYICIILKCELLILI